MSAADKSGAVFTRPSPSTIRSFTPTDHLRRWTCGVSPFVVISIHHWQFESHILRLSVLQHLSHSSLPPSKRTGSMWFKTLVAALGLAATARGQSTSEDDGEIRSIGVSFFDDEITQKGLVE